MGEQMSSSAFIETLRTSQYPDGNIIRLIVGGRVEGDILLFESTTKRYLLKRTIDAFHHGAWLDPPDGESITSYMKLRCHKTDDNTNEEFSKLHLRSETSSPSIEAVFVPLGWLVEEEKEVPANGNQQGQRRTTHYVVLWNITTKPYSLWLVYDYHSYDDDCELTDNDLTDRGLHNKMFKSKEANWYAIEHKYDNNVPKSDKSIANEFLVLHSLRTGLDEPIPLPPSANVQDFQNKKNKKQQQQHHNDTPLMREYHNAIKNHHQSRLSQHTQPPPEPSSSSSPTPPNLFLPNPKPKPAFIFLGLTTPFDLACITTDIALWDCEKGVDIHHVINCVEKTHACLGETVRATCAKPKREGGRVVLEGDGEGYVCEAEEGGREGGA